MKTNVSIREVHEYEFYHLQTELELLLDYLGGISRFINAGDRVLLKVNLLSPKKPEQAVTTHPMIVKLLCRKIKEMGAHPVVGDSSGGVTNRGSRTSEVMEISGISQAVTEEGGELINFDEAGSEKIEQEIAEEKIKLYIAKPVLEADVIINLPKLKTHGLTYFTGSVKNMFGVLPGNQKRDFHRQFPSLTGFSQMLAELYSVIEPDLTIMDGIWAMEGNGPSGGNRRDLGLLLASEDGVALDEVATRIIGFKPGQVKTTNIAKDLGCGTRELSQINVSQELSKLKVDDFKLPTTSVASLAERFPSSLTRLVMNQLRTVPVIDSGYCIKCGLCQNSCPVYAIKVIGLEDGEKVYQVQKDKCVECYCCHELCPAEAISIEFRTKLGKLFAIFRGD